MSLDRIVFHDPPKSVCVTSGHAEGKIQLKGGSCWTRLPLFILPLGCVHVAWEGVVPLTSVGVLRADKIQGQSACFQWKEVEEFNSKHFLSSWWCARLNAKGYG